MFTSGCGKLWGCSVGNRVTHNSWHYMHIVFPLHQVYPHLNGFIALINIMSCTPSKRQPHNTIMPNQCLVWLTLSPFYVQRAIATITVNKEVMLTLYNRLEVRTGEVDQLTIHARATLITMHYALHSIMGGFHCTLYVIIATLYTVVSRVSAHQPDRSPVLIGLLFSCTFLYQ